MNTIKEGDINFRNLVFEISDGIYICDLEGTLIYANYAMANLLGHARHSSLIGKKMDDFLPPGIFQKIMEGIGSPDKTKKHTAVVRTEITRKGKDKITIEINPAPFIFDGKVSGNQGVVRDITERVMEEEKRAKFLTTHEPVTGLYNRVFFEAEMKRFERGRQFPVSFIMIKTAAIQESDSELDGSVEDRYLKQVGHTLFRSLRGDEIIARVGPEDFAVLLPNVNEENIRIITDRVQKNLDEIYDDAGKPAIRSFVGMSTAEKGENLSTTFARAETVAQIAKKNYETV